MKTLSALGLNDQFNSYIETHHIKEPELGRILRQDKTQYLIRTTAKETVGELTGNLLQSDEAHPVVGDWVRVVHYDDRLIITGLLPRYSYLARQSVHSHGQEQLIAANIDLAFIVQSLDHDFNLNRLERYLAMVYQGGIRPIVILNKADLVSKPQLKTYAHAVMQRVNRDIIIIAISALHQTGIEQLSDLLTLGSTSCFIGSSGVGKSTIVNELLGEAVQQTTELSRSTGKGRHTTTTRQLVFSPNGAMVIDTPGMRELGMSVSKDGLEAGFASLADFAQQCRFSDCTHHDEPGCAVIAAVSTGQLDADQVHNYHKLRHESRRFQKSKAEMNKEGKRFGKIYKAAKAFRNFRKP